MPVAIQAVLGFALFILGAFIMHEATFWADGDFRFLLAFFFIGVLYLVNGVPTMLEGAMTMIYKKEPVKKDA